MNTQAGYAMLWMQDAYQLTAADRVLQKTPFDVSVWEFFWPLTTGARLVPNREAMRDSAYLSEADCPRANHHTAFRSLYAANFPRTGLEACNCLKRVICSGEALPFDLQQRFFGRLGAELHNLYGPTGRQLMSPLGRANGASSSHWFPDC